MVPSQRGSRTAGLAFPFARVVYRRCIEHWLPWAIATAEVVNEVR